MALACQNLVFLRGESDLNSQRSVFEVCHVELMHQRIMTSKFLNSQEFNGYFELCVLHHYVHMDAAYKCHFIHVSFLSFL